ncbi:MAG: GTPase [Candidatus Aminicenantales bacterium]
MPANLPPQYFETERKLKTVKAPLEKIAILEELLSLVPKHKGTEKLQALLKTKIAKLRSAAQKKPAIAKHGPTFRIEKAGAGQVVLVGTPNAGKSSLVKALTNANPEIGQYPFTTHFPSPGMMPYENIQIQLIDTPPITADFLESWQSELIKAADGILFLLDLGNPNPSDDFQAVTAKLKEKHIEIATSEIETAGLSSVFIKKTLLVANKIDLPESSKKFALLQQTLSSDFDLTPISAFRGDNLEKLREKIFTFLDVLRVYSKVPGKKVDYDQPFIFKRGSTLMDMAQAVHKDFAQKLKYARIWGKNKYQGQKVNREYILEDEDVIELHM